MIIENSIYSLLLPSLIYHFIKMIHEFNATGSPSCRYGTVLRSLVVIDENVGEQDIMALDLEGSNADSEVIIFSRSSIFQKKY